MILDNDKKVKMIGQTVLFQLKGVEDTARQIKGYAELNHTSYVIEEIYNLKEKRTVKFLGSFYISPTAPIFYIDNISYAAKDQEKVLRWFMERVKYYREQNPLSENEIISFKVS